MKYIVWFYGAGHDKVNIYIQNPFMPAYFSNFLKSLSKIKIFDLFFSKCAWKHNTRLISLASA